MSEGFEHSGNGEFIQILSFAKASCVELRSQLYRVMDRNHLDEATFGDLYEMVLLESKKNQFLFKLSVPVGIQRLKIQQTTLNIKL